MSKFDIECGDSIFVRGNGPFSRTVRKVTKSPYSHVAVALTDGILIEAKARGVRVAHFDEVIKDDFDIGKLQKDIDMQEFILTALKFAGYRYDYSSLFWFPIDGIFRGENKFSSPHEVICSELAVRVYRAYGFDVFSDIFYGDITPAILSEWRGIKIKKGRR